MSDTTRPRIMAVLNATPDSFYAPSRCSELDLVQARAKRCVDEGADIIDIGGASSRPFRAEKPSVQEEIDRVIPVIQAVREAVAQPISVDTDRPEVMNAALHAGATMINDITALENPESLAVAAQAGVPVCLMHAKGKPETMQAQPEYGDVVDEVCRYLRARRDACEAVGIARQQIFLDPGFGFGKNLSHNLALLGNLNKIQELGCPVLVGLSRKSFIGQLTERDPEDRLYGSLAAAAISLMQGVDVVRVHDVAATQDVIRVVHGLIQQESDVWWKEHILERTG